MTATGHAGAIMGYLTDLFDRQLPLRIRVWDNSEAGPAGAVTVVLRSPNALRYILWSPGELGVARAYVTGELDVVGDLEAGLSTVLAAIGGRRPRINARTAADGARLLARLGAIGRPLPAPPSEARPRGRRHSMRRDAQVISHHYDLSNEFYRLLLDRSMAYSCGYWTSDEPGYTVGNAQRDKLDLICRKLDLRPGARLLDIGCGWGSLTVHAAKEFGASVTAVTVAKEQRAFVADRLAREGVEHLVELRLADYREVLAQARGDYDAVAIIEMGEHVGDDQYPAFLAGLHASLRDEGRFLLQVMSRGHRHPGGGPFIERYIAPDMHMRPLADTVGRVAAAGFEVRDVHVLREHYARTIRAWHEEMERRWDEVVGLIGPEQARVWRLYLVGGALSFEENRMGVDQILAVRTGARGSSGLAATRLGWDQPAQVVTRPAVDTSG
ncbi:MAG TPA: cyclopropane-fatty-acyl-phospholipid synthase family protein [Acidimicrobiales bacterium]|jgi:cyclopropane-fatty-acyl-phospholipid synthase|nr:cyclopropane-fatty-acyl-phospholipid synthase family protein [Acidimicrobiales bacterium]